VFVALSCSLTNDKPFWLMREKLKLIVINLGTTENFLKLIHLTIVA
jgi:hypothetical protein